MRFQLDHQTNKQLDLYIKEHPTLVHNIFSEYAAASKGMDETNAKNTLVELLAKHYRTITKES
jgi:hypothetical protein